MVYGDYFEELELYAYSTIDVMNIKPIYNWTTIGPHNYIYVHYGDVEMLEKGNTYPEVIYSPKFMNNTDKIYDSGAEIYFS